MFPAISSSGAEEWRPNSGTIVLWNILAGLVAVPSILLFAYVYLVTHRKTVAAFAASDASDENTLPFVLVASLVQLLIIFPLLIILQVLVQGLTARLIGARPKYGLHFLLKILPVPYCTVVRHRFTRLQYVGATVCPALVVSIAGVFYVALAPYGGWLVMPMGFYFGNWIPALWYSAVVFRQPTGVLCEDLEHGIRFHRTTF